VALRRLNQRIDPELARWIAGLPEKTHEKLASVGLVEPREPEPEAPALGAFLTRYIQRREPELRPRSVKLLRETADRLAEHFGGSTPIGAIMPEDAADWRASMLDGGLSEATARLHARNAKAIFNAAVDWGTLDRNPFVKLKSGAVAADRERYLSADDARRVSQELPSADWRLLLALARFGGLRAPSETHALTWDCVGWQRRRLHVYSPKAHRPGTSQEAAVRVVPIVPELWSAIVEAFEAAEPGEPRMVALSGNNLHRTIRQAIARAGVEPWPDLFQTLRRSAETDLAARFPQHAVSAWIGHSEAVSKKHYLQVTDDLLDLASAPEAHGALTNALTHGTESGGNARNGERGAE